MMSFFMVVTRLPLSHEDGFKMNFKRFRKALSFGSEFHEHQCTPWKLFEYGFIVQHGINRMGQ